MYRLTGGFPVVPLRISFERMRQVFVCADAMEGESSGVRRGKLHGLILI